jgi:TolB-like protein
MVPAGLQVVAAPAGQIWGDRFENEFADLSELQEHIASAKNNSREESCAL